MVLLSADRRNPPERGADLHVQGLQLQKDQGRPPDRLLLRKQDLQGRRGKAVQLHAPRADLQKGSHPLLLLQRLKGLQIRVAADHHVQETSNRLFRSLGPP